MGIVSVPIYQAGLTTGDPTLAVFGTGESGPAGVEATIEYNGIYLNVREWYDTFLVNSIEGLADADVRDARELNPAQHGETALESYYGGRTIVLSGKIRAMTLNKLRDMQLGLRQAFSDVGTEIPLIFHAVDALNSLQILCRKTQPIVMAETQANQWWERDYQITLRASNPRFTTLVPAQESVTAITNLIKNPSFETNLNDWTFSPTAGGVTNSFVRSTVWDSIGSASAYFKWTNANDATSRTVLITTPSGVSGFQVAGGANYYAQAKINIIDAPKTTSGTRMRLYWYKADGTSASTSSSTGSYQTPVGTGTNLVTNPSFEVDTVGWTINASGGILSPTLTRTNNYSYTGGYSAQITATQPNDSVERLVALDNGSGANQFPVTAGDTYTLSAYVRTVSPSVNLGYRVVITWYDVNGAIIP